MNKSNVMEIKKTLKMSAEELPSIDAVCTCFVNGNKEKLISNTERFTKLDEEEQFKYTDMCKAALSGAIGKKLINLEYKDVSSQKKMEEYHRLVFDDENKRDELFDTIIEHYDLGENYLITIAHGVYDAPVKASDGAKLEDESNTYDFMIMAICPVHSTKAGLTLDKKEGRMTSSKQVQIVEAPVNGFLYPAFNDRQSDIHRMLYFTKKAEDPHEELMEALLGSVAPTSSVQQQNIFENILAEVTDDRADFEVVKTLHENLSVLAEDAEYKSEEKKLGKEDIKNILTEAGIDKSKLDDFDHIYERAGGNDGTDFTVQNLMELNKFSVKAPDVEIKIKPDKTGLVQKKKVDGKNCIVVTLEGDIELNGIQVSEV